jgi:hypothetical protein
MNSWNPEIEAVTGKFEIGKRSRRARRKTCMFTSTARQVLCRGHRTPSAILGQHNAPLLTAHLIDKPCMVNLPPREVCLDRIPSLTEQDGATDAYDDGIGHALLRRAGGVCGHEGYNLCAFSAKGIGLHANVEQSAISHDFTAKSGVSHAGPVKEGLDLFQQLSIRHDLHGQDEYHKFPTPQAQILGIYEMALAP